MNIRFIHQIRHLNRISFRVAVAAFVLFLLPGMAMTIQAQVYPDQYLDMAVENNPGLQSKQSVYEASQQQIQIASALPDPVLSGGIFTPPMERLMGNQWVDAGVMQHFPWFGTRQKQSEVAQKASERSYQEYRETRNSLFLDITDQWLNYFKKDKQIEIIDRYIALLQDREALIYARYEGGQQTPGLALDIYRLEIEMANLLNRRDKLNEEKLSLLRNFNIRIGRQAEAVIEIPDTLPQTADRSYQADAGEKVFSQNPKYNYAAARAEEAHKQKEVTRKKTRPTLGIGLQYAWFNAGDAAMGQMEGGHMVMPMFSVSLPVYGSKNQAKQQQSLLMAEAAGFEKNEQLDQLQTEWSTLLAQLQNLQHDHRFYHQQFEITRKSMELVMTAYAGGDEGFTELLDIQEQLLDLEWRLLENHVSRHSKRAVLDKLQATNIFK